MYKEVTVIIPPEVKIHTTKDGLVAIYGFLGDFFYRVSTDLQIYQKNEHVLSLQSVNKLQLMTTQQLLRNFFVGVCRGFKRYFLLKGLGFKTQKKEQKFLLKIGYSHVRRYDLPTGIKIKRMKKQVFKLLAIDWQLLKQTASTIRQIRVPDVYKAKGICYKKETFKLKIGKRAKR